MLVCRSQMLHCRRQKLLAGNDWLQGPYFGSHGSALRHSTVFKFSIQSLSNLFWNWAERSGHFEATRECEKYSRQIGDLLTSSNDPLLTVVDVKLFYGDALSSSNVVIYFLLLIFDLCEDVLLNNLMLLIVPWRWLIWRLFYLCRLFVYQGR